MEEVCFFDNQLEAFELPNFEGRKSTYSTFYFYICHKGFKPKSLKVPLAAIAKLSINEKLNYTFKGGDYVTLPDFDYGSDGYIESVGTIVNEDVTTAVKISFKDPQRLIDKLDVIIDFFALGKGTLSSQWSENYGHQDCKCFYFLKNKNEDKSILNCAIYFRDMNSGKFIATGQFYLDCSSSIVNVSNVNIKELEVKVDANISMSTRPDSKPCTDISFVIHKKL